VDFLYFLMKRHQNKPNVEHSYACAPTVHFLIRRILLTNWYYIKGLSSSANRCAQACLSPYSSIYNLVHLDNDLVLVVC
jgi:hypothetical protein